MVKLPASTQPGCMILFPPGNYLIIRRKRLSAIVCDIDCGQSGSRQLSHYTQKAPSGAMHRRAPLLSLYSISPAWLKI